MIRSFYEDLKVVVGNDELADQIGERITRDGVLYAFAGFYANDPKLKLSQVLANMVLHMSREREELESRLHGSGQ